MCILHWRNLQVVFNACYCYTNPVSDSIYVYCMVRYHSSLPMISYVALCLCRCTLISYHFTLYMVDFGVLNMNASYFKETWSKIMFIFSVTKCDGALDWSTFLNLDWTSWAIRNLLLELRICCCLLENAPLIYHFLLWSRPFCPGRAWRCWINSIRLCLYGVIQVQL